MLWLAYKEVAECIVTQTKMNFRHVTIASLCILVIEMSAVGMFRAMVLNFWKIFNLPFCSLVCYILSVFMMSWCSTVCIILM